MMHPAALPLPYHAEIGQIQVTPLHGFWDEASASKFLVPFVPPLLLSHHPSDCVNPLGNLLLLIRVPEQARSIDQFEVMLLGRPMENEGPVQLVEAASEHGCTLEDFMRDLLVLVQVPEIPRPSRFHSSSYKLLWILLYSALPCNPASFTFPAADSAMGSDAIATLLDKGTLLQKVPPAVPAVSGLVPRWAKRGYASRAELLMLPVIREKMLGSTSDTSDDDDEDMTPQIPPEVIYGREQELAGEHPPDESEVLSSAGTSTRRCRGPPSFKQLEAALKAPDRPTGVTALVRDYLDQYAKPPDPTAKGPPPVVPVLLSVEWIKRIVRSSGIYDIGLVRFKANPNRPIWIRRNALLLVEEHVFNCRGTLKSVQKARDVAERNVSIYIQGENELKNEEIDERFDDDSDGDSGDNSDDNSDAADTEALEEQAQALLMENLLPAPNAKRSPEDIAKSQQRAMTRLAAMSDTEYQRRMEACRKRIRLQATQHQ